MPDMPNNPATQAANPGVMDAVSSLLGDDTLKQLTGALTKISDVASPAAATGLGFTKDMFSNLMGGEGMGNMPWALQAGTDQPGGIAESAMQLFGQAGQAVQRAFSITAQTVTLTAAQDVNVTARNTTTSTPTTVGEPMPARAPVPPAATQPQTPGAPKTQPAAPAAPAPAAADKPAPPPVVMPTAPDKLSKDVVSQLTAVMGADVQRREGLKPAETKINPYDRPDTGLHQQLLQAMFGGTMNKMQNLRNKEEFATITDEKEQEKFIRDRYAAEITGTKAEQRAAIKARADKLRAEPTRDEAIGLYDLVKGADASFTRGFSRQQIEDMAKRMVLGNFRDGDVRMTDPGKEITRNREGKWMIEGKEATDKEVEAARQYNETLNIKKKDYVGKMARFMEVGWGVFGTKDPGEIMALSNALRMGDSPSGRINETDPEKLRERMLRVQATGVQYNKSGTQIVEGILQSQNALMWATGAQVSKTTGKMNVGNMFDVGLSVEQLVQHNAKRSGRTDETEIRDDRTKVGALVGATLSSQAGQQLLVADYMMNAKLADPNLSKEEKDNVRAQNREYKRILEEQGAGSADAYFRKNQGLSMTEEQVGALAPIAWAALTPEQQRENTQRMLQVGQRESMARVQEKTLTGAQENTTRIAESLGVNPNLTEEELGKATLKAMIAVDPKQKALLTETYKRSGISGLERLVETGPKAITSRADEYRRAAQAGEVGAGVEKLQKVVDNPKALEAHAKYAAAVEMELVTPEQIEAMDEQISKGNYAGVSTIIGQALSGRDIGEATRGAFKEKVSETMGAAKTSTKADTRRMELVRKMEGMDQAKRAAWFLTTYKNTADPAQRADMELVGRDLLGADALATLAEVTSADKDPLTGKPTSRVDVVTKGTADEAKHMALIAKRSDEAIQAQNGSFLGWTFKDAASRQRVESMVNAVGTWALTRGGQLDLWMDRRSQVKAATDTERGYGKQLSEASDLKTKTTIAREAGASGQKFIDLYKAATQPADGAKTVDKKNVEALRAALETDEAKKIFTPAELEAVKKGTAEGATEEEKKAAASSMDPMTKATIGYTLAGAGVEDYLPMLGAKAAATPEEATAVLPPAPPPAPGPGGTTPGAPAGGSAAPSPTAKKKDDGWGWGYAQGSRYGRAAGAIIPGGQALGEKIGGILGGTAAKVARFGGAVMDVYQMGKEEVVKSREAEMKLAAATTGGSVETTGAQAAAAAAQAGTKEPAVASKEEANKKLELVGNFKLQMASGEEASFTLMPGAYGRWG